MAFDGSSISATTARSAYRMRETSGRPGSPLRLPASARNKSVLVTSGLGLARLAHVVEIQIQAFEGGMIAYRVRRSAD